MTDPEPSKHHLVIASSYDHFATWARCFRLDRRKLNYVYDSARAHGWYDYTLVVLPDSKLPYDEIGLLIVRADHVYYQYEHYPVADKQGNIIAWRSY